MDSIRRFFSWPALLLALAFSISFGLMYSVAFHVVPKQPIGYKVFMLSLVAFVGFYLIANAWLKRVRPRAIRIEENPADSDGSSFWIELSGWICGPKPAVSIGLAILAIWVTIALYAILIVIGVRPSCQYAFAFPLMYGLLRWSFDGANGGR